METNSDITLNQTLSYKHNNGDIHTVSSIEEIKCPVIGALSQEEKKLFLEIYSDLNTKRVENELNYEAEEEISDSHIFELNIKNDTDVALERLYDQMIINEIEINKPEPTQVDHKQSKNIEIIEPILNELIPKIKNVNVNNTLEEVVVTKDNANPIQEISKSIEPIIETKSIDEITINIADNNQDEKVQNLQISSKKTESTVDKLIVEETKLKQSDLIEISYSPVIEIVNKVLFNHVNQIEPTLLNEVTLFNNFTDLTEVPENKSYRDLILDEEIMNFEFKDIFKADSDIELLISELVKDDNIIETINEELDQIEIDLTEPLEILVKKITDIVYEILIENNINCPEEIINNLSQGYAIKHVIKQLNKDKLIYDKSLLDIGTHEMFQKLRFLIVKLIDLSRLYLYLGKVSFN